ncbi:sterigmatocystin 8-O-methyltransferase [Lophiostoma macrostomum CBS 122681]|uniref:Sterigmatocystin 8-O-methyltransferase n=1 Tax=Lophiostoma macrostomum CBS 122681 TaxID=1314788 RepID=A0A6A6TH26_9PLEO|nr:sterigmatocystin 8-O-methyltransferase [Lophiostoma macrostomum CBS 122681]
MTPHGGISTASELLSRLQRIDHTKLELDQNVRNDALLLSKKLTASLEGPVNRATDLVFRPYITIAARIAVDLKLFESIALLGGPISSAELAAASGGDEVLITRILRLLASVEFVEESEPSTWSCNDTTVAMASAPIAAGHRIVFDVLVSSAMKAPKYLRETGYKAPTEPNDGFVQYANQTKYNIFEYLQSIPSLFQDFNLFMGNTMGAREYWHEWYDVESRILSGFDGRLILQDQVQVLEEVADEALPPNISKLPHDFFAPQPIKETLGARGYFLHHILHDWSDKYCHVILKQLWEAMDPGYSKLLIHELILPDKGSAEIQARYDLVMMTFNGGMERSKAQWKKLLEDVGFCNIRIWEHFDSDGIIEAEVPLR